MLKKPERRPARSILDRYLAEIAVTPLLSAEEERALGRRIQEGDPEALHTLVEANLRFVVRVAKRYSSRGVPIQDLINEGNLGLIEAARRFDPERNVRFISYAVWWIRRTIQVAISSTAHPMRVPVRMSNLLRKVNNMISRKLIEHGRHPSPAEIAEELGVDLKDIDVLLDAAREPVSLNKPVGEDGSMVLEGLMSVPAKTDEDLVQEAVRKKVQQAIRDLGRKEEFILKMRFGFEGQSPQTLKEIGDRLGLSRERVRQMEQGALERLRYHSKTRSAASGFLISRALLDHHAAPAM